jgi:DNA-binding NarL/FixJ family response regulator
VAPIVIRVVLCDSHEIALAGLRAAFGEHGFEVAGTANSRSDAMRLLASN